ncbi:MAG: monofunctional biosynthetic peptidoglycan transglycosylase [Ignavibacteria bacterium RBG_16_34_14]|nr:MAG: monofunctional biosynthetic peptidoglycan transglycosylase [Ignavibacteria bacterium RBG_16_34_14]
MHPQLPYLEISQSYEKFISLVKRNKMKSILLYSIFIFYFSIPSFSIPVLEYNSFRITSLMEQRAIEKKLKFYPEQSWVDIDDVTPNILKAIIAMEDGSFFTHKGVDWKELETSIRTNRRRGRSARGGSTITMQLAKNLFLTTEKSFLRKGKEFIISVRMEKELSKKAILGNYINAVEWGEGIFGIKEASEEYFKKEPDKLTKGECSRLAAVIPSPLKHKPNMNSAYVLRRSSIIRGRMNDIVLYPEKKL